MGLSRLGRLKHFEGSDILGDGTEYPGDGWLVGLTRVGVVTLAGSLKPTFSVSGLLGNNTFVVLVELGGAGAGSGGGGGSFDFKIFFFKLFSRSATSWSSPTDMGDSG